MRLKDLIKKSGQWIEGMEEVLSKVEDECTVVRCKVKSSVRKPVVALPRASKFNDMLTLDLKIRHNKRPILYMIDAATRMTVGEIIENKNPSSVSDAIIQKWVGGGYGAPSLLHSDGGGEFTAESCQCCRKLELHGNCDSR